MQNVCRNPERTWSDQRIKMDKILHAIKCNCQKCLDKWKKMDEEKEVIFQVPTLHKDFDNHLK